MNIIFFGTPYYVVEIADVLFKHITKNKKHDIIAVVTQPAKVVGRKKYLSYSPVDKWAYKKKLKIFHSADDLLKDNIKADVGVLASYGEIIPPKVLKLFSKGIINIHPSALPKFRGSSPVQATILADAQPEVTFIKMDEMFDHGPIISSFKDELEDQDNTQTLRDRLFSRSAEVLPGLLEAYLEGRVKITPQDHKKTSFTRQLKNSDAFIDPKILKSILTGKKVAKDWQIPFIKNFTNCYSPSTIHNFIRAMQPWPVAWTTVHINQDSKSQPKRLKILKSHLEKATSNKKDKPASKLILDIVQLEGKNPVSWKQFVEGYPKHTFSS